MNRREQAEDWRSELGLPPRLDGLNRRGEPLLRVRGLRNRQAAGGARGSPPAAAAAAAAPAPPPPPPALQAVGRAILPPIVPSPGEHGPLLHPNAPPPPVIPENIPMPPPYLPPLPNIQPDTDDQMRDAPLQPQPEPDHPMPAAAAAAAAAAVPIGRGKRRHESPQDAEAGLKVGEHAIPRDLADALKERFVAMRVKDETLKKAMERGWDRLRREGYRMGNFLRLAREHLSLVIEDIPDETPNLDMPIEHFWELVRQRHSATG
ncbi:unnamed protein product [Vitrella brassicaformis CCMP3155]|uniref:Uncharacterized protein n=1 Tax=Vitrella brassicaformis (strain CCMP3155) TaxID=1169540 RepID=A0A0G4E872_VITBC|nr:unnamed protein product [Vitrella brassicaformis CCMP3155]|eukprot:CEL91733.1 unnamed protein product [Vitrella brassicaformis CCMP3155]